MTEDEILIRSRTQLDVLLVNIETAVKIKRRSDFFSWVQGVFQGLLAHEILICALFDPAARSYRMESMSSHPLDEQRLAGLCGTSGALIYRLIALWERDDRQPIAITAGGGALSRRRGTGRACGSPGRDAAAWQDRAMSERSEGVR